MKEWTKRKEKAANLGWLQCASLLRSKAIASGLCLQLSLRSEEQVMNNEQLLRLPE